VLVLMLAGRPGANAVARKTLPTTPNLYASIYDRGDGRRSVCTSRSTRTRRAATALAAPVSRMAGGGR
jgi:hypothetical protein